MKVLPRCLLSALLGIALSAALPAYTQNREPENRTVRTGTAETAVLPDPSPDRILHELGTDVHETRSWFSRERDALMHSALGSAVSILAGALLIWLFRRLIRNRLSGGHPLWKWEILNALILPAVLLGVLIACLLFSLPVLKSLPRDLHEMDMRFFYAAITLSAAWSVFRLVSVLDLKIRRLAERRDNALDNLTVGLIGNTLKIAIAAAAVLFIGQNIFRLNITALLASAGVIGLAVALAAKDTVSNFFGTVVVIADCPFRLGDHIATGNINGIVTHVGMRSSRILTPDESLYTIPNSILTDASLCNLSRRGTLKHVFDLGLTCDTSPEQLTHAVHILHEIMDDFHGADAPGFAPHIFFSGFQTSSLNIHVIIWFKTCSFQEKELLLHELNMTVLEKFNQAGLTLAYPTQTIFLQQTAVREDAGSQAG